MAKLPVEINKKKKKLKNEKLRIASGDHLILNSKVQMLPDGQVQKASRTVCPNKLSTNYAR